MPLRIKVLLLRNVKTFTVWLKRTKLSHISAGKTDLFKRIRLWHVQLLLSFTGTLVFVLTLTRVKPRQLNEFCSIPACLTRSVKVMTAPPPWYGWDRSRDVVS